MFSKVKRRLEKKPPTRSTICTTPRFLMKKTGKVPNKAQKGEKQAVGEKQKGEGGSETAVQQQKRKKTQVNKTQKEGRTEKNKKASQKTGANSSGAKLKK